MYRLTTKQLKILAGLLFLGNEEFESLCGEFSDQGDEYQFIQALNELFSDDSRMLFMNARYELGEGRLVSRIIGDTPDPYERTRVVLIDYCVAGMVGESLLAGISPLDPDALRPEFWLERSADLPDAGMAIGPERVLDAFLSSPRFVVNTMAAITIGAIGDLRDSVTVTHFHHHPALQYEEAVSLFNQCLYMLNGMR